ncbi:MAG: beta strand repeat-containing protein [Tepidisphaerales bacterium]
MRQNKKTRARAIGRDSFVENLENRTLLNGTVAVTVAAGAMTITGDPADNSIIIQDTGVGTFNITGTNNTAVTYSGTTYPAGTPAPIASADKDVTINMSQGGNDTVDAANSIKLIDASGNHYSLTYNSVGSAGNNSLFKSVAASGMAAMLDAPVAVQESQDLTTDQVATGGTYTITVGALTTPPIAAAATATTIGTALDTLLSVPHEIQVLALNRGSSAGTYTIDVNGTPTSSLNYDDNVATIAGAIDTALGGAGGTVVVGTVDAGGPITVTLPIYAGTIPLMTIDTSSLTGIGGAVTGTFSSKVKGTGGTVVGGDLATDTTINFTFPSYVGNLPLMTMDISSLAGTTSAVFAPNTDGAAVGTPAAGQVVISDTPGVASRGSITLTAQAVAGDRVTINDGAGNVRTYTAVGSGAVAGQFNLGGDMYATATNLASAINNVNPVLGVTAVAAPVGTKEQQTLTPTGSTTAGNFTITYGTSTTGNIAWNGNAAAVQTALRLLSGLSAVTVTGGPFNTGGVFTVTFPVSLGDVAALTLTTTGLTGGTPVNDAEAVKGVLPGTPEIQTVTPGGLATAGTYTLSFGGNTTTALAFGASTATVQTALRLLPGLSGIVVGGAALSVGAMNFTFPAAMGDVNMIALGATSLTPSLNYNWVETTRGIAPASCKLTNDVLGAAGNQSITVSTFSKPRITAVGMTGGGITNVVDGNTVVLNDGVHAPKTFTFGYDPTDVAIGATAAASANNLIAAINAVGGSLLINASTTTFDGTIDLLQEAAGLAGNTTITVTGAQLAKTDFLGGTNGTNIQDGDTILVDDGMDTPVTFTARSASPDATLHEFLIGGSSVSSMANFVAAVNSTPLLNVTAVDNYDGTCTITNNVAGTFGNGSPGFEKLLATSATGGAASVDMAGGAGYSIECLNVTATMGSGTNAMGIGAGGSGQSYIYGNVSYTGGAGDDSVAMMGAFVGGTLTVALGAADTTTGDSFVMGDDGTVPSFVAGDASITQTTGLSTVTLQNKATLNSSLEFGGKLTIDPGPCASGTQVTTLNNTKVDGQFIYGAATDTDADTLNFTGSVDVGDLSTITMGAGANQWNTVGTQEVQTLTPDSAATAGTYTFTYAGQTTAPISYNATLAQTQAALRLLPGCQGVVVTGEKLVGSDEVQTITPKAPATAGTYTLTVGSDTTAPIAWNANAATVQTELRRFTASQNIVVGGAALSVGAMTFTYPNEGDVAPISIADGPVTALTPAAPAGYTVSTTTPGGAVQPMIITFPADAGRAEMLAVTLTGLTGTTQGGSTLVETTKGSNFNFGSITGGAVTYAGLAGTDAVTLGGKVNFGGTATIGLGDGNNTLTAGSVTVDGAFSATGGIGADTISLGATGSFFARGTVSVSPGAGTNSLTLDNADVNGFTYTGLAGDDSLTVGTTSFVDASTFTVAAGDGTNTLTMPNSVITGAVSYTGGLGADTATIGAGSFDCKSTVTLAMGAAGVSGTNVNAATLNGRSKGVTYTGGSGTDTLKFGTIVGRGYVMDGPLSFTGGTDTNELDYDGTIRGLTYTGGTDADIIKLGAGVVGKFASTAAVTIAASDGANTTTIKNATIRGADGSGNGFTYTGGAGVDIINVGAGGAVGMTVVKGVNINTGAAIDQVNINNSAFCATSGGFVLNTGLGDDIVNFDASGTGSIFNRAVSICAGGTTGGTSPNFTTGGGNDVFNDSVNTKYLGRTVATKVSFYGFRTPGAGNINSGGAGAGAINGTKLIAPSYT